MSSADPSYLCRLTLAMLEGRMRCADDEIGIDLWAPVFQRFNEIVHDDSVETLRLLVDVLSDVAWDLAVTWADSVGSDSQALEVIRRGDARGW